MDFSENGDTLCCFFSGRLDGSVCSEIEPGLLCRVDNFKQNRPGIALVFDLAEVDYISSAFLRLCLIHCKSVGKNYFSVVNTSEEIHKVFHISGFSEIMNVSQIPQVSHDLC